MTQLPHTPHPALAAWTALRASGAARGALVTMVRADGGASRSLGTHLALADDGRAFGSVTIGGCADGRALDAARRVLHSGTGEQLTVPLSEEDALALGLGCAGDVDLLVEPVSLCDDDAVTSALDDAVAALARGERAALIAPLGDGAGRLLVRGDGTTTGTTGRPATDAAALAQATEALRDTGASAGVREGAGARWFTQVIVPARTVLIVGATDVAAAICALAVTLGWRTVVVDPRDAVLAEARFEVANERHAAIPVEVVARHVRGEDAAAVVVVAHDYRIELPVLRAALRSDAPYVGMLGSRKRGASMRQMLLEDGLSADQVARLRSPIGLAIGAQGPAEIAVSVVAELIAAWRQPASRP
jgi:xanthine dehydrogenase accessory factor